MGLMGKLIRGADAVEALSDAAQGVAEVFTPNATKKMELNHAAQAAALEQHGVEFGAVRPGYFDRFVNGLNRLPRPMLALGTLGLFIYAMVEPAGFAARMAGLAYVPDPLWWLLGAIVSFYFGAREMHYFRAPAGRVEALPRPRMSAWRAPQATRAEAPVPASEDEVLAVPIEPDNQDANPALEAWRKSAGP